MAIPQSQKKLPKKAPVPSKPKTKAKSKPRGKTTATRGGRRSGRFAKKAEDDEDKVQDEPNAEESPEKADEEEEPDEETLAFPVVITTYEMIIRDRAYLANYDWGYIVVDEGHRLKNLDCRLVQEIKKYHSAGRMILSGTPLQVSLTLPRPRPIFNSSILHRTTYRNCGLL